MRIPTLRQIESILKRYGLKALAGVVASVGIFFRDWLIGLVAQSPSHALATIVIWLEIAFLVLALVGTFYFLKSQTLEKAILKFDPDYYAHREFDEAFDEFTKNS